VFHSRDKAAGERGAALIVALWLTAILSLTALGLAYHARMAIQDAGLARERLRALYLCKAMIARAVMAIERDTNPYNARNEPWCAHLDFRAEGWLDEMGLTDEEKNSVTCDYAVWDESGKINVNVAGNPDLYWLSTLQPAQASAILDWVSPAGAARPGGAQSDYYESLTPPYQAKNAPIQALEELFPVKGVTPDLFLGTPDDSAGIAAPYSAGLRADLTVYGDGLINVNTATPEVLAAISPYLSKSTVSYIAQRVRGPDGILGTQDDDPFTDLSELAAVPGITDLELAILKSACTLKSSVFSILCRVTFSDGKVKKTVHAVVARDAETGHVKTIAWREY
jgi:general secretion pathway protein K